MTGVGQVAQGRPPAGGHGGDGAAVAAWLGVAPGAVLDLSASCNPFAPDLRPVVARHVEAGALSRYPDDARATAALAEVLGVDPTRVLLTNGGAEAIALVAAERPSGWVQEPEFSLYRRHLRVVDPAAGRWRSNPNNPTGQLAPPEAIAAVWDEAFYALATGRWTRGDAARGSVVVGSLTKVLACPGLRIGYVVTPDEAMRHALARRRPQWSVNGVAAAALPEMLGGADLTGWHRRLAGARSELVGTLSGHGLAVRPSDANWVLVDGAPWLRDALLPHAVVVRDCTSFGLPGTIRLAVPGPDGLARLEQALDAVMDGAPGALGDVVPQAKGRARAGIGRGSAGSREDRAGNGPPSATGGRRAAGNGHSAAGNGRVTTPQPEQRDAGDSAWWRGLRGAVMVCGTGSDAGKSAVATGLCRLLARHGVRVAPFKAQNMALNSWVTDDGAEIGRAQAVQAEAAGVRAEWAMNPVLLKPTGERTSQVVVAGRPWAVLDVAAYREARAQLAPTVHAALAGLRARFDVVVVEGAGSPAEINLLTGDFVNLGLARGAGLRAVVVGDIERGGVFAALYGTVGVLPPELSGRIGGFVVNKFRGDPALLDPGLTELAARTGVPVLGVVPWLQELGFDAEDSLALDDIPRAATPGEIDVAVIRLPRLSNATDIDALRGEPGVSVRLVDRAGDLGEPDLVVVPGSKTTVADLAWLRERGLDRAIGAQLGDGGPVVLAVCGGYQMAGRRIVDGVESAVGSVDGLGWLPVDTVFRAEKVTRRRVGRLAPAAGVLGTPAVAVAGYEIHHGLPVAAAGEPATGAVPWLSVDSPAGPEAEGMADFRIGVLGTSLHGLLEGDELRRSLLAWVARRRGRQAPAAGPAFAERRQSRIDRLADAIEASLDMPALGRLIAEADAVAGGVAGDGLGGARVPVGERGLSRPGAISRRSPDCTEVP